jgi:hypothetical protein
MTVGRRLGFKRGYGACLPVPKELPPHPSPQPPACYRTYLAKRRIAMLEDLTQKWMKGKIVVHGTDTKHIRRFMC